MSVNQSELAILMVDLQEGKLLNVVQKRIQGQASLRDNEGLETKEGDAFSFPSLGPDLANSK